MAIKSEEAFHQYMTAKGWEITRGFPDYCCFHNGHFILVEVKGTIDEALAPHQFRVATAFETAGIKVFRWSPDVKDLISFKEVHKKSKKALRQKRAEAKAERKKKQDPTHGGRGIENWERNQALWDVHLAHPDYSAARLGRAFGLRRQVVARIIARWQKRHSAHH